MYIPIWTTLILLAAGMSHAQLFKAEKPAPKKPEPTMEKVKALGEHLGRALDLALDILSGNQADLFSKNKAALLSGNKAAFLSGNAPKVLSENQTPIFSGNKISFFSNLKVEIHIENSGNGAGPAPAIKPVTAVPMLQPSTTYTPPTTYAPTPAPYVPTPAPTTSTQPPASKEVEQPSGTIYFPPSIPSAKP
jgi:hypothetical protein